jgi:hypothetical protein
MQPGSKTEEWLAVKKPVAKIRDEIAKLQEQLRQAEGREAERIGRIALRAGLSDIEVDDAQMLKAFEELAGRFRRGGGTKTTTGGAPQGAPAAE